MMDYQEGYCDGLAGAGIQSRVWDWERTAPRDWDEEDEKAYDAANRYEGGFLLGSLDRKTMLHRHAAFARWADGLMNSTAGDVMQPVERDPWADGMGDGNA